MGVTSRVYRIIFSKKNLSPSRQNIIKLSLGMCRKLVHCIFTSLLSRLYSLKKEKKIIGFKTDVENVFKEDFEYTRLVTSFLNTLSNVKKSQKIRVKNML